MVLYWATVPVWWCLKVRTCKKRVVRKSMLKSRRFGMSSDNTALDVAAGKWRRRCAGDQVNALRDAAIEPAQIGCVNARGTSTPAGDKLRRER